MAASKKNQPEVYKVPRKLAKPKSDNPKWLVPTATTLLVAGTLWIVTYYILGSDFPFHLGFWNIIIGFSAMLVGMGLLTRWKKSIRGKSHRCNSYPQGCPHRGITTPVWFHSPRARGVR